MDCSIVALARESWASLCASLRTPSAIIGDTSQSVSVSAVGIVGISVVTILILGTTVVTTVIDRRLAIRVNITNHRSDEATIEALLAAAVTRGKALEPSYVQRLASLFQKVTRPLPVTGLW